MNVLKNMEAIFIVTSVLAVSASAFAAPATLHDDSQAKAGKGQMIQVVIQGHGPSPAQPR